MNIPKKVEGYYNILEQFREQCDSSVKKVIDIFTPLLYKNNSMPLTVSVGNKDGNCFIKYLSAKFTNYSLKLDCHINCVCINVYNNQDDGKIAFVLNLNHIKNISIGKTNNDNVITYRLSFDYPNGVHYILNLVCNMGD